MSKRNIFAGESEYRKCNTTSCKQRVVVRKGYRGVVRCEKCAIEAYAALKKVNDAFMEAE